MSTNRYTEAHRNPAGPGDSRPTALKIIKDEGLEHKMAGKVFLVTGVSSGIGIETVRALAATDATVYGLVRDLKKGEQALGDLLSPGRVELLQCELDSLASIRSCAAEFMQKSENRLNVLITNAGVMAIPTLTRTKDGFETQFGTNHLGHFLLFQLVKPALLASSMPDFQSRVVSLTSIGHRRNTVHFDNLNFEKGPDSYTPYDGYGQSKTANIYMANYIERQYGKTHGLHGLAVHPGGIWTGLAVHITPEVRAFYTNDEKTRKNMKSPEQGAATSVLAAVGKDFEGRGRVYLENCGEGGPLLTEPTPTTPGYSPHAFDEEAEDRLWKVSCQLVGVDDDL